MFYIAVSSIGKISVGEKVVIKEDALFGEISAERSNGEVVGYVSSLNVEGCVAKERLERFIPGKSIVCDVVLKSGDVIILGGIGQYSAVEQSCVAERYFW